MGLLKSQYQVISFIAFVLLSMSGDYLIVTDILLGLYIGSFWNLADINALMFAESAPTVLRGSILGCQGLIFEVGTMVSTILCVVLLTFVELKVLMLIVGVPVLTIGTVMSIVKLKETKGVNLQDFKYTKVN